MISFGKVPPQQRVSSAIFCAFLTNRKLVFDFSLLLTLTRLVLLLILPAEFFKLDLLELYTPMTLRTEWRLFFFSLFCSLLFQHRSTRLLHLVLCSCCCYWHLSNSALFTASDGPTHPSTSMLHRPLLVWPQLSAVWPLECVCTCFTFENNQY